VATLEVKGRRSGRAISFPVVIADREGSEYLVSMLGEQANWVKNVRAAGGAAVLRRGRREDVTLEEVDVANRAPIIRRYAAVAPGGRPHLGLRRDASLQECEALASGTPVFRITSSAADKHSQTRLGARVCSLTGRDKRRHPH
jgi:deazaflavin-dependent oxidoreductase (nitroreductase family)